MSLPISISLDLSTPSGSSKGQGKGAWDDRELIRAYDAALEEFHIHHPGPGTWLDKATAAKAQGQPLSGARAFGTSWYTAPEDVHREQQLPKRKRGQGDSTEAKTAAADNNPYSGPVKKRSNHQSQRAESPAYAPPSPSRSDDSNGPSGEHDEPIVEEGEEEVEDDLYEESADQSISKVALDQNQNVAAFGTLSSASAFSATYEDAIAYAMSAQYAAGYWLGVAHSKSASASTTNTLAIPSQPKPPSGRRERPEPSSNLIRTRQEFPATQMTKLRR